MIQCKDFAPRVTERGPFGGASEYESFSEVVSAVNQWIESTLRAPPFSLTFFLFRVNLN